MSVLGRKVLSHTAYYHYTSGCHGGSPETHIHVERVIPRVSESVFYRQQRSYTKTETPSNDPFDI